MAEEGMFEVGGHGDLMRAVPISGAGRLHLDDDELRLEVDGTQRVYAWHQVLSVGSDKRDSRVMLIVVLHEGETALLRFRPARATPAVVSDLGWAKLVSIAAENVRAAEATQLSRGRADKAQRG